LSQIVVPGGGGGGLTEVTSDATLTGLGTGASPLSVVNNYASTAQGALADTALQTVSTDATLTGTGVSGDPLSVVPAPASLTDNVSAYVTVDIAGLTSPVTKAVNTVTEMTPDPAFTGTSVAFNGVGVGGLQFTAAGTYQVTFQVSWETLPAGSKTDFNVDLTILDAPGFGTVVARSLSHQHLETGDVSEASASLTKTFVFGAPNTFYYLQADFTSATPIDFSIKGDATNYSYVEVLRLA